MKIATEPRNDEPDEAHCSQCGGVWLRSDLKDRERDGLTDVDVCPECMAN